MDDVECNVEWCVQSVRPKSGKCYRYYTNRIVFQKLFSRAWYTSAVHHCGSYSICNAYIYYTQHRMEKWSNIANVILWSLSDGVDLQSLRILFTIFKPPENLRDERASGEFVAYVQALGETNKSEICNIVLRSPFFSNSTCDIQRKKHDGFYFIRTLTTILTWYGECALRSSKISTCSRKAVSERERDEEEWRVWRERKKPEHEIDSWPLFIFCVP